MVVVLAAVGAFLYFRLEAELDRAINDGLRTRTADIAGLLQSGADELEGVQAVDRVAEESVMQILDPTGLVLGASRGFGEASVLSDEQLARALAAPLLIDAGPLVPDDDESTRLFASPIDVDGATVVVVTGTSLEDREDALHSLLAQLLVIAPIALLVTSVLGYVMALFALRPVDAMRRRAATISAHEPGARLPVDGPRDEVARLGETLNAMLERLEAALARERQFVADASHELRTPLALLKTELELAQRSARTRDELEAAIRSAAEETDRLAQLAEDLLLLARSDDDALALRESDLSSRELLTNVADRFRARAERQGRDIRIAGAPDVRLWGDELRLEQALGNLVDNALRHGAGAVTVSTTAAGDHVELCVIDEGEGFPAGFVGHAFERFSQADKARTDGSSGLGLAIVDVIARAHGGSAHLGAEGAPQVWLALPLRAASSAA